MKTKLQNIDKAIQRKEAISQGFYDGRFRSKVVSDKKALEKRFKARKKVCLSEY